VCGKEWRSHRTRRPGRLASRRGPPDRLERPPGLRAPPSQGASDGATGRAGRSHSGRLAAAPGRGVKPPADSLSAAHRALRPGGQDPAGGGGPPGVAARAVGGAVGPGTSAAGQAPGPHGGAVSSGSLAAVLAQTAASACVSEALLHSTARAASLLAAGRAAGSLRPKSPP